LLAAYVGWKTRSSRSDPPSHISVAHLTLPMVLHTFNTMGTLGLLNPALS
jgi:hypothetical protein